ncbi:3-oxoadipyl-CoA thiolase [Pantoea coffeiphila]|uniref:Beta-ketoadipyl-CoA thiolase n=1 Tax=Pantoea coffeiphila TaxID=1465635 RepID=A0A2S9I5Y1_9GAMM|nr:3-oxoadipyl-CoA thiolase [Pantoea coffeiphila]PRD13171.1 3-oxoadipyl-CoA thiolase [Pantoea coffeiphila]
MNNAWLCDAVRTPFGRLNGGLATIRADELAALPIRALVERHSQIDWRALDDVLYGCANQAGEDNRNVGRMALLLAGLPASVPGCTVNRLCGSSLDAVAMAARSIHTGENHLLMAGGVEHMTRSPFVMSKADKAFSRQMQLEDTTMGWRLINPRMKALYGVESMPQTAENLAAKFDISREDMDALALRSQQRTADAQKKGFYRDQLMTVEIAHQNAPSSWFSEDEHPRPVTLSMLEKLKPVTFPQGTVTAGNASGLNDGACALLLASDAGLQRHQLTPLARIIASAITGIEPTIMGLGPVAAIRKVLAFTGLTLEQMDVIELNEAFAAQVLAVTRELGLADDEARVNPNGGAIALGHPLGASGGRLVMNAAWALQQSNGRYGLCAMCIGVGQGIAMIIERS